MDDPGFAGAYAALARSWGADEAYAYPPEGKVYRRGVDGGLWLVDAPADDATVMRPIVEQAMYAEGMGPRPVPQPVIPNLDTMSAQIGSDNALSWWGANNAHSRPDREIGWRNVASLTGHLLALLDGGEPFECRVEGQSMEDFARRQLARVVGAALAELITHAIDTGDDDALEAVCQTFTESAAVPEDAVAVLGQVVAAVLPIIADILTDTRPAEGHHG